mgnify:CR=1 FL=1
MRNIIDKFKRGWNWLLNKLKFVLIPITIAGSGIAVGNQVGRPECDYIITDQVDEICLTQEQVDAIYGQLSDWKTGFGNIEIGGRPHLFDEK